MRRRGTSQWAQSPPGEDFRDRQLRAALDGEPLAVMSGRLATNLDRIEQLELEIGRLNARLRKLEVSR